MPSRRIVCSVGFVGVFAACGSFSDAPPNDGASSSGGVDGGPSNGDAGRSIGPSDAAPGPDVTPTVERIPTVAVAGFRITPTEISQAQYKVFLDESAGKSFPQPSECQWNTSFAPPGGADCIFDASATPNRPVRCVDWCDAHAYCEWAGLRLCGKIGGGPTPLGSFKDPALSQWHAACGGSANMPYPYGGSLDQSACSFNLGQSGPPTDVGTMPGCEGGYPGVFDMLGNMGEWEDSCVASTGATDACRIRGGYYAYAADAVTCGTGETHPRNQQSPKFGIRCCSK
jgi:formylglycine-generating enzyme